MELFFGIIYLIGKLIHEAYQEHKANQYADRVVHRYDKK